MRTNHHFKTKCTESIYSREHEEKIKVDEVSFNKVGEIPDDTDSVVSVFPPINHHRAHNEACKGGIPVCPLMSSALICD